MGDSPTSPEEQPCFAIILVHCFRETRNPVLLPALRDGSIYF